MLSLHFEQNDLIYIYIYTVYIIYYRVVPHLSQSMAVWDETNTAATRRGGATGSLRVRLGQGLCGWTQPGQPPGPGGRIP